MESMSVINDVLEERLVTDMDAVEDPYGYDSVSEGFHVRLPHDAGRLHLCPRAGIDSTTSGTSRPSPTR